MEMFFVKIHTKLGRQVLAICDDDILGKTFEDGDLFFEVKKDFYEGEKLNDKQVRELLINVDNFNIIGKRIIVLALELKIIDDDSIMRIKGVPHAQGIAL